MRYGVWGMRYGEGHIHENNNLQIVSRVRVEGKVENLEGKNHYAWLQTIQEPGQAELDKI